MEEDEIDAKEMTLGQRKISNRDKEEKETRKCTKDERKKLRIFCSKIKQKKKEKEKNIKKKIKRKEIQTVW